MPGQGCPIRVFRKKGRGFAAAAAAFLLIIGYMLTNYRVILEERSPQRAPERSLPKSPEKPPQKPPGDFVDEKQLFSFIPTGLKNCEALFKNGTNANLDFSSDYITKKKEFDMILTRLLKRRRIPEGHIGTLKEQSLVYFLLAKAGFVKTICETGFNAGHSALVFLTANPDVQVYSFDLGEHRYSKPMADSLQKTFPGRLKITWGNSIETVPAFIKANPDVKCDIISIDGGHDYKPCKADLRNLRGLARKKYHILYIDDYPINIKYMPGVRKAWEEELAEEQVQEHFKCRYYSMLKRGFTVGKYINL